MCNIPPMILRHKTLRLDLLSVCRATAALSIFTGETIVIILLDFKDDMK